MKQRITLNLDAEVVEMLKAADAPSASSAANRILREELRVAQHRQALRAWVDEMIEKYGEPGPEARAWAREAVDELFDEGDDPVVAAAAGVGTGRQGTTGEGELPGVPVLVRRV